MHMYAQYKSPTLKMLSQQKDKNRKSKKHKNAQRRLKIAQTYSDCLIQPFEAARIQ